jgi:hypothetical protein
MADTTGTDRPAAEPAPDAAVEALVDALTAPGTPEELAVEEAYVAAFLAARNGRDGTTGGRGRRARRRLRIALVGGVAAFAVTGTAAALTGSLSATRAGDRTRPPLSAGLDTDHRLDPTRNGSPRTPAMDAGRSSPSSAGSMTTTPAQAATRSSPQPAPSPRSRGPAVGAGKGNGRGTRTGRPAPGPTPQVAASALVNFCRQFGEGKLPVESAGYRALAAAAGSAHAIPVYCASLGSPPGHQEP